MKILYLSHDDLNKPYAWRTHALEIINSLLKRGHYVHLVAPGPLKGVNIANLTTYNRGRWNYLIGSIVSLVKEASKTKFDIIYLRGQHLSLSHFFVSFIYRIPLVIEVNGFIEDELLGQPLRKFIYSIVNKLSFYYASKIITISESLGKILSDRWGFSIEKIGVVSNGANPKSIYPLDKKECRKALGLSDEKIYFLYASSFYLHHAHTTLVKAVNKGELLEDINFILLGDGVARKDVENEIKRRDLQAVFTFCGEIENDLMSKYLGACDIAILVIKKLTDYHCSPIKLFEAMSAGRPVLLSSNCTEIVDFVRQGNIGLSAKLDIDRPQELAALINEMLQNRNMWQEWSENGRNLILEKYSWDKSAEKLEAILESIS